MKYMVVSRDQNAGKNSNIKIGNKSLEIVEQFKHLGKTLTKENYIHEEQIQVGECLQNLLSSKFLPNL
jgi:hypothetical protein